MCLQVLFTNYREPFVEDFLQICKSNLSIVLQRVMKVVIIASKPYFPIVTNFKKPLKTHILKTKHCSTMKQWTVM